ncbi:DUF6084 family protein [Catellatospora paridis]|uniref:DUF6084 family protein n=1 Tax=Catellatospora paridis TaxID=1617086 RepID=UPI0012D3E381|nr:DUF6084 family protein [Catellatospora paridis]
MAELTFACVDAQALPWAAGPTLRFRLRITAPEGVRVHALVLSCQLRIDPRARTYSDAEAPGLDYVFGAPARWATSMQALHFATVGVTVPGFTGTTEFDLMVPCTYDLEPGLGKYLHALAEGTVPMTFLFSGTLFEAPAGGAGVQVGRVPWDREAAYALPVAVWRELMDLYFPDTAWLRLRRDTVDALLRHQARHAVPTADELLTTLLAAQAAAEDDPSKEDGLCPTPR